MFPRLQRLFAGLVAIALLAVQAPAFAGGGDLTVQIGVSNHTANSFRIDWSPVQDDFNIPRGGEYAPFDGYAVFLRNVKDADPSWAKKPLALLKKGLPSSTYYDISLPAGTYNVQVALYAYNVVGYFFAKYGNQLTVVVGSGSGESGTSYDVQTQPASFLTSNTATGTVDLNLTGTVKDCMLKYNWTTLADSAPVEGYAVFLKNADKADSNWFKQPFGLLKKKDNNYNYYNLSGMPAAKYLAKVAAYTYDVSGYHFDHYSNEVTLDYTQCGTPSTPSNPPQGPQFDLSAPGILQPTAGQLLTNYPRVATYQWTSVAGAGAYEVVTECDICGSGPWEMKYAPVTTSNTYYVTQALAGDNQFRFHVRAVSKDGSQKGNWSEYRYFTYKTSPSTTKTTPWFGQDVTIAVAVNGYPKNGDKLLSNAYVNMYKVTPVSSGNYSATLMETKMTGSDGAAALFTVKPGEMVDFRGFVTSANAKAATSKKFLSPPWKNFTAEDGVNDRVCQINFLDITSKLFDKANNEDSCLSSSYKKGSLSVPAEDGANESDSTPAPKNVPVNPVDTSLKNPFAIPSIFDVMPAMISPFVPVGLDLPNIPSPKPPTFAGQKIYVIAGTTDNGVVLHFGFTKTAPSFDRYRIERWEVGSGSQRLSDTKRTFFVAPSQNSYVDTEVLAGRKYAYRVTAIAAVDGETKDIAYSKAVPVVFVDMAKPLALKGSYDSEDDSITLKWKGGVKPTTFNGYALYITSGDSADLSSVSPILLPKSMKGLVIGVEGSGVYHFRVYQYQSAPNGSAYVYHQPGSDTIDVVVP